jgi:DNA-binding IclR family transcriptional regulator
MKQELQSIGAPQASSRGTVTGRSFAVLFAVARSDDTDVPALRRRLGMGEEECRRVLDDLQRRHLLDAVSRFEGRSVSETLRLTEDGEATLLRSLERMCELPEGP